MERRFAARRDQLLADAEVDPRILRGVLPRLERFLDPFVARFQRSEQAQHARHYVAGLLSRLEYKNVESIAYLHDQEREPLQQFIGQSPWDHRPWLTELACQVGQQLGSPDGVLVFDPSAFPKKGKASVGVQRQWCGRLGKLDNCQVGIFLAYVGRTEHALVDVRLYLPKEWAKDKQRRTLAGVPKDVCFRTRHELALEMLAERGELLPHAWVSGDDELGRCSWFRQELRSRHECYLLAVPSNTASRDLTAAEPPYAGHGRRPCVPFRRVDRWCAALPESAWQTLALVATWFLTAEARRGKKMDPGVDGATSAEADSRGLGATVGCGPVRVPETHRQSAFAPDRRGASLPLEKTQPLAPTEARPSGIRASVEVVPSFR